MTLARKIDSKLDAPELLTNLSSACTKDSCPICELAAAQSDTTQSDAIKNADPQSDAAQTAAQKKFATCQGKVLAEKTLFSKASLNAARIVVRGVMTIEVKSIPPTIDEVKFDNEEKGAALWAVSTTPAAQSAPTNGANPAAGKGGNQAAADKAQQKPASAPGNTTAPDSTTTAPDSTTTAPDSTTTAPDSTNARTGVITGKFLKDGTPQIVDISVSGQSVTQGEGNYIVDDSLKAIPEKSSDTSLSFTLNLGTKPMPPGTKLTFQVSRTSSDTGSSDVPPGEFNDS